MSRVDVRAAAGTAVFLFVAPGVVGGLVPWWLTSWRPRAGWPAGPDAAATAVTLSGGALILAGALVVLAAFARFVVEGRGTPAPVAPTERLVVGGLYRHVRNPMYLAVAAVILGQYLVLGRPVLLVWAAVFMAAVWTFVTVYEQPVLAQRYGGQYAQYRAAVPGWWPRWRAWAGPAGTDGVSPPSAGPRWSRPADRPARSNGGSAGP